jgi:polyisoprenoid-binding protein YceI
MPRPVPAHSAPVLPPALAALCVLAATLFAVGVGPPSAAAQELQVDPSAKNVVRFTSRTQVDEFGGVTDKIDGYVLLDGAPLSAATGGDDTELYFEVDLASLDTGIGLRDRHMRDEYLEVKKYPYASFKGKITHTEVTGSGDAKVTAAGTFSVHGVSMEREIVCDVTSAGSGYRAECAFPVLLSDHNIDIPKVMFLKLSNEIQLDVQFTVSPAGNRPGRKP